MKGKRTSRRSSEGAGALAYEECHYSLGLGDLVVIILGLMEWRVTLFKEPATRSFSTMTTIKLTPNHLKSCASFISSFF